MAKAMGERQAAGLPVEGARGCEVQAAGSPAASGLQVASDAAEVEGLAFARGFARVCSDGWTFGWHEANGGNLSYVLSAADEAALSACLVRGVEGAGQDVAHVADVAPDGAWRPLPEALPALAGRLLLVSASGCFMRNVADDLAGCAGVIELDMRGAAWRIVWGFAGGGRPTSELFAHLLIHAGRVGAASPASPAAPAPAPDAPAPAAPASGSVVYHAHTPHLIALSNALPPKAALWNDLLADTMTEVPIFAPEGIAVLKRMEPGSVELARAAAAELTGVGARRVCVWARHGAVSAGTSFDDAFGRLHAIEKAAGIYLEAQAASR